MPVTRYKDELDSLLLLAERQAGFVSAAQATDVGITHAALARLVHSGHLERYITGVYQFARWPLADHADLWPIVLWAQRNEWRVALSHRTALALHAVSDINPSRIDVTVPRTARFRGTAPRAVELHYRDVGEDLDFVDGLPVTSLYRTLLDLIVDRIAPDAVDQVLNAERTARLLTPSIVESLRAAHQLGENERLFLAENVTGAPVKKRP